MASPPQITQSAPFLRVPREFRDLHEVHRWAQGLLRALELQLPQQDIGVHQGTNIQIPSSYPYTAQVTDYAVLVNTAAPHTINLPKMTRGFILTVKDATGGAGANNITVNPAGAERIDGGLTFVMNVPFQAITFLGSGVAWPTMSEWLIF